MYVYKLNEDIILYKHSSENNQSGGHMVLARVQHTPGHRNDCTKGRLEIMWTHITTLTPESSDQKSSNCLSSFLSFLFSRNWVVVPEWNFA